MLVWALIWPDLLGNRRNLFGTVTVMCARYFGATTSPSSAAHPELATAYADSLGDLDLGSPGALLAGLVVGHLWRHPR